MRPCWSIDDSAVKIAPTTEKRARRYAGNSCHEFPSQNSNAVYYDAMLKITARCQLAVEPLLSLLRIVLAAHRAAAEHREVSL